MTPRQKSSEAAPPQAINRDIEEVAIAGSFQAELFDTVGTPLTVDRFVGSGKITPGNVGVCLSGGGSRAMTAGMGQLAALDSLGLLSQVKAISTVSGGSWLGVSWCFLKPGVTNADFLGAYQTPGSLTKAGIASLPADSRGNACTSGFAMHNLVWDALCLKWDGTPWNMLWQTLMGIHMLEPLGLFQPSGKAKTPSSLFSADATTLQSDVVGPNPTLGSETAHLLAPGRPFLLCNTAMFVESQGLTALAPVQSTPYFTGIVGKPDGTDANQKTVGGGGVTSFAFSSQLQSVNLSVGTVNQTRQWSLTDIVGSSSAAFAATLGDALSDPKFLAQEAKINGKRALENMRNHLSKDGADKIQQMLDRSNQKEMEGALGGIGAGIVPAYTYWPVLGASAGPNAKTSEFADGGNLENTGVASLLSYDDIDNIIAFVNSSTPLAAGSMGVIDPKTGHEIPNTRIVVDGQLPELFGFQPYDAKLGYVAYSGPTKDYHSRSQVFSASDFAALLQGLWNASNGAQDAVNFQQSLLVKTNPWFGVAGGKTVTVLWTYLNKAASWTSQLTSDVSSELTSDFPNYATLSTELKAEDVNLIGNLTAWCVCGPGNAKAYQGLFH